LITPLELVSPDQNDLQQAVAAAQRRMLRAMVEIRNDNLAWLQQLVRRLNNQHPQQRLLQRAQRCDELDLRLQRAMQLSASRANSTLGNLQLRLRNLSPQRELVRRSDKLSQLHNKLHQSLLTRIGDAKVRLTGNIRALQTISPLNTLARGYAIVQQPSGEVVTSTDQVSTEQKIRIRVSDGEFGAISLIYDNPERESVDISRPENGKYQSTEWLRAARPITENLI